MSEAAVGNIGPEPRPAEAEQRARGVLRDPSDVLLEVRSLGVRYGGVTAVEDLSFDVPRRSVVGLIGPNGAGKTSVIDALTGFTTCTGSIKFDGRHIECLRPHKRARAGLVRTFQSVELFDDLSVVENIVIGHSRGALQGVLPELIWARPIPVPPLVEQLLEIFELHSIARRTVARLSTGQRKLVALVRALAAEPRLVLLDEPAAALDERRRREVLVQLRKTLDLGTSILLVDHDMDLVLEVCDTLCVLDFGHLIASGAPDEVRCSEAVIAAYLGRQARK